MTKKINKLFKILESKKFKEKLGSSMFLTRISSIIYKGRIDKKMSQEKLKKMVGTTQRIISDIENGNYNNMGCDLLYRTFKVLDKKLICDGKDLISGEVFMFNLLEVKSSTPSSYKNFSEKPQVKTWESTATLQFNTSTFN